LIRRLECVFGHDEHCHYSDLIRSVNLYGLNRTIFKKNGIVSVYKSRSSTQIDKKVIQISFNLTGFVREVYNQKNQRVVKKLGADHTTTINITAVMMNITIISSLKT